MHKVCVSTIFSYIDFWVVGKCTSRSFCSKTHYRRSINKYSTISNRTIMQSSSRKMPSIIPIGYYLSSRTCLQTRSHHRRDLTKLSSLQYIEDYWKLSWDCRQLSSHQSCLVGRVKKAQGMNWNCHRLHKNNTSGAPTIILPKILSQSTIDWRHCLVVFIKEGKSMCSKIVINQCFIGSFKKH